MAEVFPALRAGEGPFPRVGSLVYSEMGKPTEAPLTLSTGEGFLGCMDSRVCRELLLLPEAFPTGPTFIHFLSCVNAAFVAIQVSLPLEAFLTHRIRALSLTCLRPLWHMGLAQFPESPFMFPCGTSLIPGCVSPLLL